jgi:hypothetical protein
VISQFLRTVNDNTRNSQRVEPVPLSALPSISLAY